MWGVAYRIQSDRVAEVKEYLDIREKNGYTYHYTPFHPSDPAMARLPSALVYIGTPENDQFVGPQDPQALAEHIYRCEGPSGLNRDYLWDLEKALSELGPDSGDEHVSDLSDRVRRVAALHRAGTQSHTSQDPDPSGILDLASTEGSEQRDVGYATVSSTDEQQHAEKAL